MILEAAVLVIGYWLLDHFYLKRRKLPPGPTPLPIVGNVWSMIGNEYEPKIREWHRKYGDIMTIWLGNRPVVTLHDSPAILETFLKDGEAYAGRPENKGFNILRGGRYGIIFAEGELWRDHRRFVLHVLRNFGLGKNLMQERILVEVTSMIADIRSYVNDGVKEISLVDELDVAVGSIINAFTFGYRYADDKRNEFFVTKSFVNEMITASNNIWWRFMSPYVDSLKNLPVFSRLYTKNKANTSRIREMFMKNIYEHKKTINFDDDQEPADYVEAFLRQQHKLDQAGVKNHNFCDNQLYGTVFDLWLAGQETTSVTLAWIFLYLMRHPECQEKVFCELEKVVGSDRIVTCDDRAALNYLSAAINECQRMCNLLAFNVQHKTTKPVTIHGYSFPAGTVITNQISTVMSDERYFKNPDMFLPERFLDENGKFADVPEMMQFGVGKRACLGESLARMELFLFTANLLNQFRIKPVDGVYPDETRIKRAMIVCKPYKCQIQLRR